MDAVLSYRYLGVHITEAQTSPAWFEKHTSVSTSLGCVWHQSSVLTSFYRCGVESVLYLCITMWHRSCSIAEKAQNSNAESCESCTEDGGLQPRHHQVHQDLQIQETDLLHHERLNSPCAFQCFPSFLHGEGCRANSRTTRLRDGELCWSPVAPPAFPSHHNMSFLWHFCKICSVLHNSGNCSTLVLFTSMGLHTVASFYAGNCYTFTTSRQAGWSVLTKDTTIETDRVGVQASNSLDMRHTSTTPVVCTWHL